MSQPPSAPPPAGAGGQPPRTPSGQPTTTGAPSDASGQPTTTAAPSGAPGQPPNQASPSGASGEQQPSKKEPSEEQLIAARTAIEDLIRRRKCGPILLLIAFHDAFTYDASSRTGGPNGSISEDAEKNWRENSIIKDQNIWSEIKNLKEKHQYISIADLLQLAGIVAMENWSGRQRKDIEFVKGRKDSGSVDPSGTLPNVSSGRLPSGDFATNLRRTFYRMGFRDREIVALAGVYGLVLQQVYGIKDPRKDHAILDNTYYKSLLEIKQNDKNKDEKEEASSTQDQKRNESEMAKEFVMKLEECLATDQTFKKYVILYSENNDYFFKEYAKAHKKMSELGFKQFPKLVEYSEEEYRKMMPSVYIATVMTIAVVVLGFVYETMMK